MPLFKNALRAIRDALSEIVDDKPSRRPGASSLSTGLRDAITLARKLKSGKAPKEVVRQELADELRKAIAEAAEPLVVEKSNPPAEQHRDRLDRLQKLLRSGSQEPPPPEHVGQASGEEDRDGLRIHVGNRSYRVRHDDPVYTGQMVRVKSSNVHSVGFIWNPTQPTKGTLKVRYLDKRGGDAKPGATYYYMGLHPEEFSNMLRASSKGGWVWDNLRVRGTVAGHHVPYRLASIGSDGYVPRQAVRANSRPTVAAGAKTTASTSGKNQYLIPRSVRSTTGTPFRSILPPKRVGPYRPSTGPKPAYRPTRGRREA